MTKSILGNDPFATHPDWAARLPAAPAAEAPRPTPHSKPAAKRPVAPAAVVKATAPVPISSESAPTSWRDNIADWLFPLRFAAGETLPNAKTLVLIAPSGATSLDLIRLARRLQRLAGRSVWAVGTPETPMRERIVSLLGKNLLLPTEEACRRAQTGGAFVVRSEDAAAFRSLSSSSWPVRPLDVTWPKKRCPVVSGSFLRPFTPGKLKLG